MSDIGLRIKKLRQEKHMALKELAAKTTLTSSFLSQLENGLTSPSVDSLRKIADALGTTVGDFFKEKENKEFVFIRKKRDPRFAVPPVEPISNYEVLASSILDIRMLPLLMRLKKNEILNADACPKGEELLGVALKGKIEIAVNGKQFILEPEDTIYLVTPVFSYCKNVGEEDVSFLWNALRV
ncbi:MAG: XRE family transcriptional regulator [Candidatus Omnitrophota bacterium]|jgi:transcriptional regulator with XRE-family HTH domain